MDTFKEYRYFRSLTEAIEAFMEEKVSKKEVVQILLKSPFYLRMDTKQRKSAVDDLYQAMNEETLAETKLSNKEAIKARNKAINIEKTVADALNKFSGRKPTPEEIKQIVAYMEPKLSFSLGKMSDELDDHPVGWLKKAIEAVKDEANKKGFGKTGGASKTLTQPERVDRFLRQKQIGPIKR